jgi:DNA-binding MarR family transcriptional regulator
VADTNGKPSPPEYDGQIDRLGHIAYVLKRVDHSLENLTEVRLRPHGISVAKYAVLRVLNGWPDLSGAQLARRCFVTPQSMNAIVNALEQQGLVTRAPHPENARVLQTRLTPAGKAVLRNCRADVEAVEAAFLSELSEADQALFDDLLRKATMGLQRLADER